MTSEYRWRGHERQSTEVLRLDGNRARSEVSFGSWMWRYEVTVDDNWVTTSATVGTLSIEHGERGWIVDGTLRPDLADAVDVDIVLTPFTNTLPIRRRPLEIGERADFVMAWVDAPSLEVTADPQRYTRLDANHYRFDSLDSAFTCDLEVDDDGIVVRYPGLFDRI